MNLWEMVLPPIVSVVATAVAALAVQGIVALAKYYIPKVKAEMGEANFMLARETVKMIVRAIEQSPAYTEWDGAQKKQKAIMSVANWFDSKGLPVTSELIDGLIESAVQEMNAEIMPLIVDKELEAA